MFSLFIKELFSPSNHNQQPDTLQEINFIDFLQDTKDLGPTTDDHHQQTGGTGEGLISVQLHLNRKIYQLCWHLFLGMM